MQRIFVQVEKCKNIKKIFFEHQQMLIYKCAEMATVKWVKKEEKRYSHEKITTHKELL